MKKQTLMLTLLLALSITIPMFTTRSFAYDVTKTPATSPKVIEWINTTAYDTLLTNPEFLVAHPASAVPFDTVIYIDGKDVFGKDIEANALIPANAGQQFPFIFNDTNTVPPKPVAFAQITKIFQANGTDNERFKISTQPYPDTVTVTPSSITLAPYPVYLGEFDASHVYTPTNNYAVGNGLPYKTQDVAVEPYNPEPLQIVVNWADGSGTTPTPDLIPQKDEVGGATNSPTAPVTVTIEGLDLKGNPLTVPVTINNGDKFVSVNGVFSTVCKVWSTGPDSYYIFTNPTLSRDLFYYYLLIDHVTIHPGSYDILANPDATDAATVPTYLGVTNVTVALRDADGNLIKAADYGKDANGYQKHIIVNFYSSGGKIQPSTGVYIEAGGMTAVANLTADTNPRTVNVTADANVPPCQAGYHPELDLFVWTQMTFDGVNSANGYTWGDWPITTMQWGYTDPSGTCHTFNDPPKPWLPSTLGGPTSDGIKLDGPIYEVAIPLWTGCNLVSSPVSPLLVGNYYTNYPTTVTEAAGSPMTYPTITNKGIPMDYLFGKTSAVDTIEAIWWYDTTSAPYWHVYIPGVSADPSCYFRDGVGYWIKAEQPCTLEISGVWLENGPFTPPTISLKGNSWSLVGVTSINAIQTSQYLESTMGSTGIQAAGPVWQYTAPSSAYPSWLQQGWIRDPSMVYPGQAFWVYNKVPTSINIAP